MLVAFSVDPPSSPFPPFPFQIMRVVYSLLFLTAIIAAIATPFRRNSNPDPDGGGLVVTLLASPSVETVDDITIEATVENTVSLP